MSLDVEVPPPARPDPEPEPGVRFKPERCDDEDDERVNGSDPEVDGVDAPRSRSCGVGSQDKYSEIYCSEPLLG